MYKKFFFFSAAVLLVLALLSAKSFYNRFHAANKAPKTPEKAAETQITLIEGWTVKDIGNYLENKNLIKAGEFLAQEQNFSSENYSILESKPAAADLEGFIFPDTYRIAEYSLKDATTTASAVIQKALSNLENKFTSSMRLRAKNLGYSPFQILTLASILEKETGSNAVTAGQKQALEEQRKIIAGIFYNRLKIGQPLQSDATINYITKKNDRQAAAEDLLIDSPYNTYKYKGLPPGPICNPSLSSIMAVLYPTATDYYYFLHKPNGEAVYSKTFEEHVKNKNKYLK